MTTISQAQPVKPISWLRHLVIYAILLLVGFMIGFVPMWVQSRASDRSISAATDRADLARTQNMLSSEMAAHKLTLATMQNTLASAAIDARRGDYESARQAASAFYTSLRAETERGSASTLSQTQREGAQPLFALQDELITLLSRNDPAAAERLSRLYVSFRELMSK